MTYHSAADFVIFKVSGENSTDSKIRSYETYEANWNFGEGVRFNDQEIGRALRMRQLFQLLGYTATDAFPGSIGEIAITAYKDDYFLQVIVEPGGLASVMVKDGHRVMVREYHVTEARAKRLLREASRAVWVISEELTSKSTTTLGSSGSIPWHSDTLRTQLPSRFSYGTAY